MSVAEIKAQAESLSYEEMGELSRYLRGLVLSKNPERQAKLRTALKTPKWVTQEEFDQAVDELEKRG